MQKLMEKMLAKFIDDKKLPIVILGAGSFGTALALHLARLGQPVWLWSHRKDQANIMAITRVNEVFLPEYPFPDSLKPTADLAEALQEKADVLIAVPSHAFHKMLIGLQPFLANVASIISATKGLDPDTGFLLHQVTQNVIQDACPYAVLSGPSFAREVAKELPTAVVIASTDPLLSHRLAHRFKSATFRVYSSTDVMGVEIGGAIKNILAIATGIADGMGLGANARSALITRGLAEMMRLATSLGAAPETLMGLAGVGDLVLTCTDDQSRNRRFGIALGKGKTSEEAAKEIGQVVEGYRNAELVVKLANEQKIEMPISQTVWNILQGKLTPATALEFLFARELKEES